MTKIFISHSSKDKDFVRKLSSDLKTVGLDCWLDEWEIKVGDCIVNKIEEGLKDSRFLVIVLSKNSIESGWVGQEWKSKYWDEVNKKEVKVLPALLDECEVPQLLKTKKYADFTRDYDNGFKELVSALDGSALIANKSDVENSFALLNNLLQKAVDRNRPLSGVLAEGMSVGYQLRNNDICTFCKRELTGDFDPDLPAELMNHRQINVFISWQNIKNVQGFGGFNFKHFWQELSQRKEFFKKEIIMKDSVTQLESSMAAFTVDIYNSYITIPTSSNEIFSTMGDVDTQLYIYASGNAYHSIYDGVRNELTKLILENIK